MSDTRPFPTLTWDDLEILHEALESSADAHHLAAEDRARANNYEHEAHHLEAAKRCEEMAATAQQWMTPDPDERPDDCTHCGLSTALGGGRFVNRIPSDYADGREGYMCPDCQQ